MATFEVTPAIVKEDGQNRIAKTTGQAGVAGAVVIVASWLAQQVGWDGELPLEVSTSITFLLTSAAAWLTNRRRLRGEV